MAERMRALEVGTWVQLTSESGRVEPAKVSWVSPISSRLLFVNRRGIRVLVASAEELAAMARLGRVQLREADTAFDDAMQQVMGRLKAQRPRPKRQRPSRGRRLESVQRLIEEQAALKPRERLGCGLSSPDVRVAFRRKFALAYSCRRRYNSRSPEPLPSDRSCTASALCCNLRSCRIARRRGQSPQLPRRSP